MRRMLPILSAAALLLALSGSASASTSGSIVGLPAWDAVHSESKALLGVAALSPTDIWAVGTRDGRTLTEHSTGTGFTVVRSPDRADRANVLEDVEGVAPDDLWAVGHSDVTDFVGSLTLAEHWDGSKWRIAKTPNLGDDETQNVLTGVSAVASDDVWAVGSSTDFHPGGTPLIFHWNGSRWSRVANNCGIGLTEVDAIASNDVWAVGGHDTCHWDGTSWKHLPAAKEPTGQAGIDLRDVTIVGSSNVWAVGIAYFSCGEGQVCPTGEIQHWTGGAWQHVTDGVPVLYGVTSVAADDLYAVGLGIGPAIMHYDGSSWSKVPSGFDIGELQAVDASGPNGLWAAGDRGGNQTGRSLVEHAPSATSGAVAGGSNVGDATISWFGKESGSVQTNASGDYQVGGLPAGRYRFTATNQGCVPDSVRVQVVAGTTIGQNFHIDCG